MSWYRAVLLSRLGARRLRDGRVLAFTGLVIGSRAVGVVHLVEEK
jgi:hypothetical protein